MEVAVFAVRADARNLFKSFLVDIGSVTNAFVFVTQDFELII